MNPTNAPRRIALVIWSLEAGGAERVMSTLANAWSNRGEDVSLITLSGATRDHYALSARVGRIRLRMRHSSSIFTSLASNAKLVRGLRRALREVAPDVVISFMDRTNNQVLVASRGLGIPVIVSERVDPRHHAIPMKARLLRRVTYPLADMVVVQTDSVRRWAERVASRNRVAVIPNPVVPCRPGNAVRGAFVLGVGRLVSQKGFDLLIEAFANVAESHPDWRLVIVGDGPDRSSLEGLAAAHGMQHRTEFVGVVDDPVEYLSTAGVFVLASRYEGFPNVVLEAMACGTAVIATDCESGPGEIIEDDVDGVLVPPEDVPSLAAALGRLMGDRALRSRLGAAATKSVGRYALDPIMERWNLAVGSVLGRRPS